MASEIVKFCDVELANDVKVEAASVDVTIGGFAYQLDLCAADYDTYVKPLLTLMTEHGRKVGTPAPAVDPNDPRVSQRTGLPRRGVCPFCDTGKPVFFSSHAKHAHDLSLHEFYVKAGWTQPTKNVCYMCAAQRDLGTPQGIGAHARSIHGLNAKDFAVANEKAKEATADKPAKKATAAARPRKR